MAQYLTATSTTVTGTDTITAALLTPPVGSRNIIHSVYWSITTVSGTVTARMNLSGNITEVGVVTVLAPLSIYGLIASAVDSATDTASMVAGTTITTGVITVTYSQQRN